MKQPVERPKSWAFAIYLSLAGALGLRGDLDEQGQK
jgi:hypothetical protein